MIRTQALRFSYPNAGARLAFGDLEVGQGEALLVQGPSGSGKSTFLALCCALLGPHAGRLEVAGQDLSLVHGGQRDRWRGQVIGFMPQRLYLNESLCVRDNLALAFFAAGVPQNANTIENALRSLHIETLATRLPRQLSGGQAQRVALARAILLQPKLIVADEPTASLDDEAAQSALGLLLQAVQNIGASLVVATHDRRAKQAVLSLRNAVQLTLDKPAVDTVSHGPAQQGKA